MPELSLPSPVGLLTLHEEAGAITAIAWGQCKRAEETPLLRRARVLLERYFAGEREEFALALRPSGSAFERRVWAALRQIPYGATRTYGEIAQVAGGSPRAVGRAVGKNPIPIIIPCHRVVAAGGLGGFSAPGGLATKRVLLGLEAGVPGDLFGERGPGTGRPAMTTSEARA